MFSPTLLPTLKSCQPFFRRRQHSHRKTVKLYLVHCAAAFSNAPAARVGHDGRSITSRGHKRPWHQRQPKDLTPKGSPSNGFKNHLRPSKSPKRKCGTNPCTFSPHGRLVTTVVKSLKLFGPDGRTRMNRAVRKQHWTTAPVCRSAGPAR